MVPCDPPGIGAKKVQEISESRFRTTYIINDVALERAGVDLNSAMISINSSALEVACPPPGIGAKKIQEISRNSFGSTYIGGSVALEDAVVDLHIGTTSGINSPALEVACSPPGIGAKIQRTFLEQLHNSMTTNTPSTYIHSIAIL